MGNRKHALRFIGSIAILIFMMNSLLLSAGAEKISEKKLEIIKERTVTAMENLEEYVDLTDLDIQVNMYSDRFSPEYEQLLCLLDDINNKHGAFCMGSHSRSFCMAGVETQLSEGNDSPYGVGPNDVTGISIGYDNLFLDENGKPSRDKILDMKTTIQKNYQLALDVAKDEMTDVEKALAVYDYLIALTDYPDSIGTDPDGFGIYENQHHDVTAVFYDGISVCSANSTAYAYLLSDLGIPVVTLTSHSMDHEWPMVKLDGNWYHADLTWDNSRYEYGYTSQGNFNEDPWDLGAADHVYFLKSDKEITELQHHDWELLIDYTNTNITKAPKANVSNAYADAFFSMNNDWGNYTNFQYINGRWYACDPYSGKILDVKYKDEKNARLFSPVDEWIKYAYAFEDDLYLCTENNIYRYNTVSGENDLILRASDVSENAFFSEMRIAANRMDYVVVIPDDIDWYSMQKSIDGETLSNLPNLSK